MRQKCNSTNMKQLFLILILAAGMHAATAQAGLGWTLAECRQHYKSEGSTIGKDSLGLDVYEFYAQTYLIYAKFDETDKAISMSYQTRRFDDGDIEQILATTHPTHTGVRRTKDFSPIRVSRFIGTARKTEGTNILPF